MLLATMSYITVSEYYIHAESVKTNPVAFVSPELDGKPARVTSTVVRTGLATNSREADGDGALLARLEDIRQADVVERVGGPVVSVGTATLCVDDTLRNAFTVEVGEKVD